MSTAMWPPPNGGPKEETMYKAGLVYGLAGVIVTTVGGIIIALITGLLQVGNSATPPPVVETVYRTVTAPSNGTGGTTDSPSSDSTTTSNDPGSEPGPTEPNPSDSSKPIKAAYLLDMNWVDFTNTGPQQMVTGLATVDGRKYKKSFTTGRCWVDEVVVQLDSTSFKKLQGVVGYATNADTKQLATVEISATTSDLSSSAGWRVIDSLEVTSSGRAQSFSEDLPDGVTGIRLSTVNNGCVPDITWADPRVS